jgi:short-subunit dehydrogenase
MQKQISKLAAVGVAEALHAELLIANPKSSGHVNVVVLCPGFVRTNLIVSSSELHGVGDDGSQQMTPVFAKKLEESSMSPSFCADKCFENLASGKFFCILNEGSDDHSNVKNAITARYNEMMSRFRPSRM